ncbi:NlpC/P60 family protein [Streptomyces yaanensis]|uniref:NlpC/P60 family protein n=1 Tax=Streptomyces yaanensis TaxID=1142239 RepID=A0ABV7S886_9ACTN|nr:NlpC/P60 family protein [Streptomyces sp. CGMCC 4.7035]WNB99900.1 NlpC/P60 family protein [Streptomyces sp. CGMCC 4.7035]
MAPEQSPPGPSREEVQQRIRSLYDRAETDSGTYNATRAMMTGGARRGPNPGFNRDRRRSDPSLDNVARQWFDAARAKLGPTVPAVLPADRVPPELPAGPTSPTRRAVDDLLGRGRETTDRPLLELTAGPAAGAAAARPVAELTAGPVAELTVGPPVGSTAGPVAELTAEPVAELTAGPVAELTAGPVAELTAGPVAELTADPLAAWPVAPQTPQEAPRALPASVAQPRPTRLSGTKEQNQQKFAVARELLSRRAAQHSAQPMPIESRPAEDAWRVPEEPARLLGEEQWRQPQQPDILGTDMSGMSFGAGLPVATAAPLAAETPAVTAVVQESGYDKKAAKALAFARAQIGRPCVWGASGPDSYDAAGLTQAAWRAAGVVLPRTAQDQAAAVTAIPLTDLQPGDLIFFYDTVSHVSIYTGNGMMIHAPSPGASIREESIFYAGQSAIHSAARPA